MKDHPQQPLPDYIEYPTAEMEQRASAFYEEIRRRHTVRDFSDRPVDKSIIENCIRAAGTAPSGANHQPWFFAAIHSAEVKKEVRLKAEQEERSFYAGKAGEEWLDALNPLGTDDDKPYLETAPWLIAIFAQRKGGLSGKEDRKNYYINESCGIATGFLIAALHQAGLATLTHTPKPMDFLNEICGRPRTEKPYILLVTGYPAENATIPLHAVHKKTGDDLVQYF
ncbi:MAG: nitroreductase family protein [Xanthomonadales bacterium]|nr:nitroreductase family protein [Xanthomonadales bacterium]